MNGWTVEDVLNELKQRIQYCKDNLYPFSDDSDYCSGYRDARESEIDFLSDLVERVENET